MPDCCERLWVRWRIRSRQKESSDTAIPSGNSVAYGNLVRLSFLTGDAGYLDHAIRIGKAFSEFLSRYAHGNAMMLGWHEVLLKGPVEVIITGHRNSDDTRAMLDSARSLYAPELVLLFKPSDDPGSLEAAAPFTAGYRMVDGKATAYVCRDFTCNLPTHDVDEMVSQITAAER